MLGFLFYFLQHGGGDSAAAVISLLVYGITLLGEKSDWIAKRTEFTSVLIASVIANIYAVLNPGSNPIITTLCSPIVLIPGLSLTEGIGEISNKYIVSGFQRLVNGVMITFKLFIRALVGS